MMKMYLFRLLLVGVLSLGAGILPVKSSFASSCSNATECITIYTWWGKMCVACQACTSTSSIQGVTRDQFNTYRREFLMDSFYQNTVKGHFQSVANESRNASSFAIGPWGAFLDASAVVDTLTALQKENATSLTHYTPSDQICRFGTVVRSLAASDSRVNADKLALSEASLGRNLGRRLSSASSGRGLDQESRLRQFADDYCNLSQNASGLDKLCATATQVSTVRQDLDINYTKLMDNYPTINANMLDKDLTRDEATVMAMGSYLYGHKQIQKRTSLTEMNEVPGAQSLYAEYRSVVARRAAAQNTFNTLAALKMAGSGASDEYMKKILAELGMGSAAQEMYFAAKDSENIGINSSYDAQMNLLTKQLYQTPAFYAKLIESPANTRRISAAMQGIGLMQSRDMYRSVERSEMLMALLAELEARKIVNANQGIKER